MNNNGIETSQNILNQTQNEIFNYDTRSVNESDIYLIELQKKLNEMKKERKQAENDANLLENRLNLLKEEESKTWKNIEKSRKQATLKVAILQKMEEERKQKLDLKEKREREIEEKRQENLRKKHEIKMNTLSKKDNQIYKLKKEASMMKDQKRQNEEVMRLIKEEETLKNKHKNKFIKNEHKYNVLKKDDFHTERKNKLIQELEKKLLDEQDLKEKAEEKCKNLENNEMEIINRIQTTTQLNGDASDLKSRIASSASKNNLNNSYLKSSQRVKNNI